MSTSLSVLTLLAALGSGLMAGLFFAFSVAVMQALAKLPAEKGMAAMQSINVAILNPVFLAVFLGTALMCLALVLYACLHWSTPGSGWLLIGGGLYLVGCIAVTMACNVPLNNALAAADATSTEGAKLWHTYLVTWTNWNHVRAVACLGAMGSFVLAIGKLFR